MHRRTYAISNHRQSRWYEEGPLKGPSDEAQFTLVPIRAEALSLTVGPPAPVVPSSRSLEAPPHGGINSVHPSRQSSCPSVPPRVYAPKIPVFLVIVVGNILKHKYINIITIIILNGEIAKNAGFFAKFIGITVQRVSPHFTHFSYFGA